MPLGSRRSVWGGRDAGVVDDRVHAAVNVDLVSYREGLFPVSEIACHDPERPRGQICDRRGAFCRPRVQQDLVAFFEQRYGRASSETVRASCDEDSCQLARRYLATGDGDTIATRP